MNRHWTVKLDDVAEINPRAPKHIADDDDVAFVPMSAVSENGSLGEHGTRPYAEVKKGYTYFERGDILLAKITPCFENGKAALVDNLVEPIGFGSTEFHVLRPGPDLDGGYLFYMLWNEKFRAVAAGGMTGSAGQKRVPAELLRRTEIRLPPLDEQRRIAAILDKADALRQKRKRAVALLDSLTQSIFFEMFGDVEVNDRQWHDGARLDEVAAIGSGITKGRPDRGAEVRSVPYMAVANVQERRLDLSTIKSIDASEAEISKFRLEWGDLLLTEGGDPDKLGRGTLWRAELPEAIHQNHIFRVRFNTAIVNPLFANWLIGSARGKRYFLQSAKQTTGIASINKSQLSSFPMLLPPFEVQQLFADRVGSVQLQLKALSQAATDAELLFASLQHRAFSGQL